MRYLAIVLGRCSNHQYSCKNFNMVTFTPSVYNASVAQLVEHHTF